MKLKVIPLLVLFALYGISRLINLTILPVFADEAIYIRWAQMISYDPGQYAFLPLYDGKTPLFMWFLALLIRIPTDPLVISRVFSAIIGIFTLWGILKITTYLSKSSQSIYLTTLIFLLIPFSFFYFRMALIDGLLTCFMAWSYYFFIIWRNKPNNIKLIITSGIFWGFAVISKTSAFYFLPVIAGVSLVDLYQKKYPFRSVLFIGLGYGIGLSLLGIMAVSPMFPFLFHRSSDFAYKIPELIANPIHIIQMNMARIFKWIFVYATPIIAILLIPLLSKKFSNIKLLMFSLLLFLLPFLITGKLLSSRYFLPVIIFIVPALSIYLSYIWSIHKKIALLLVVIFGFLSLRFTLPLLTDPGNTPFTIEDKVQYLTEWSAGYGIPQVRDYLKDRSKSAQISVATEGFFGTLPDGLYIYFDHTSALKNMEIFGIGQPIHSIPHELHEKAKTREVYLVVNEHRFFINPLPDSVQLVGSYPRPSNAPALHLYRIYPKNI